MELLLRVANRGRMIISSGTESTMFEHVYAVASILSFRGIGIAIQFAMSIVLGRVLGADGLGVYYLYISWMVVLSNIFGMGLPLYTLRSVSYMESHNLHDSADRFVLKSLMTGILVALTMAVPIFLFAPALSVIILKDIELTCMVQMVSLAGVLFLCLRIISEALQARGCAKLGISGETTMLPGGVIIVSGIILYTGVRFNSSSVIVSHLAVLLVVVAVVFWIWKHGSGRENILNRPDTSEKPFFSTDMLTFWGNSLLTVLFVNMPILLLTYFATPEEIGHFGVAYRLMGLATTILIALASIFGPRFARHYARKDIDALSHDFHMSQVFSFLAYVPFLAAFFIFASPILSVFGPGFGESRTLLWIMAGGQLFNSMTGLVGYLLNMIGKEKVEFVSLMIATCLMFFLSCFLGMKFGCVGVATGYAVTLAMKNAFSLVLSIVYLKKLRKKFQGALS